MQQRKERYGIFTAVAMIVGICIGSGIFFKSDNILIATGGSVFLGVAVFTVAAFSVVFGGLCMSQLAARTDKPGGAITYFEEFGSTRLACGFGWFQIFIYYPTISTIVTWVVGIYVCILFNLPSVFELQLFIGAGFCTLCFIYNLISPKLGGIFQNAATIIKLIPLFLVGIMGLVFGDPAAGFANLSPATFAGATWITAIAPIAFSYDGWIVSTSISHEVKNSKQNMPLALIIAPVFILISYVAYFVGVSSFVDPQAVMQLGDQHVELVASHIFGNFGAKAVIVFVTISVMGTVNGLVLGFIRVPYALALRGNVMLFSKQLRMENSKLGMPLNSAVFGYLLTLIWTAVHFAVVKLDLLPNSDISEISIAMSYVLYTILYFKVFALYKSGAIKSVWVGVIYPIFATLGALFILSGSMQNVLFYYYAAFCMLVFFGAFLYYNVKKGVVVQ